MNWLDDIHGNGVGDAKSVATGAKNAAMSFLKANVKYNPLNPAAGYNAAKALTSKTKKAATTPAVNQDPKANTKGALYEQIRYIEKDMFAAGFPNTYATSFAVAVIMLESDWLTSNLARNYRNYAGIKWANQKFGSKGPKAPDGGYYAAYKTFLEFSKDFLRILSLNGSKGRPIDATSATAFMAAMQANHYFTDPNYVNKWNAAYKKVYEAVAYGKGQEQSYSNQSAAGQNTFTYDGEKGGMTSNEKFNADRKATQFGHWIEDHPILAGAAGLAVLVVVTRIIDR